MGGDALTILVVEDNPGDAHLVEEMLQDAGCEGMFQMAFTDTLASARSSLAKNAVDLVLLDLTLPDSYGLETFTQLHMAVPDVPIVVLSGTDDEQLARKAVQQGAQDYLVKGSADCHALRRAIQHAIERYRLVVELARQTEDLAATEQQLRSVLASLTDAVFVVDGKGHLHFVNRAAERLTGKTAQELRGDPFGLPILHGDSAELTLPHADGPLTVEMRATSITWEGQAASLITLHDITHRKQAEDTIRRARDRAQMYLDVASVILLALDLGGTVTMINRQGLTILGCESEGDVVGQKWIDTFIPERLRPTISPVFEGLIVSSDTPDYYYENPILTRTGEERLIAWRNVPVYDSQGKITGVLSSGEDITERRRAEQAEREQRTMAEALRDTAGALTSTLDQDAVLERVLSNVGRVVPHDAANIMVIEDGQARVAYWRGYPADFDEFFRTFRFRLDATPNLRGMYDSHEPCLITHTEQYEGWLENEQFAWVKSYVAAPIRTHDQVMGFVSLDSREAGFFTADHAERLQTFATQAAIALENAQLYATAQRHTAELEALRRLTLDITAQLDIDTLLLAVVNSVMDLLNVNGGGIYLYNPERDVLEWRIGVGSTEGRHTGIEVRRGEGLSGRVWETNEPLIVENYHAWDGHIEGLHQNAVVNVIGAPISYHEEFLGVINARSSDPNHSFSDNDRQLLGRFASQAAVAIKNAQLYAAEQEQRAFNEALNNIAVAINSTLDMDELLDRLLVNVQRVVPHDVGYVMLIDGDTAHIMRTRRTDTGAKPAEFEYLERHPFDLHKYPILADMRESQQPVTVANVYDAPDWVKVRGTTDLPAYIAAPIRWGGQVQGFLNLRAAEPGFFTALHAQRLLAFADQAATGIQNAQYYNAIRSYAIEQELQVAERTAELAQTKDRIEAILNSSSDAIIVTNPAGEIDLANPHFYVQFGFEQTSNSLAGLTLFDLVAPAFRQELIDALQAAGERGESRRLEIVARDRDGIKFDVDVALSPILDVPGHPSVVCSLRDITQRKQIEANLRDSLVKERELSDLRTRFVTMVSHQFRTPLATIQASSEALQRYFDRMTPDQRHKRLETIHAQIRRLTHMLEDILTLGKLEGGGFGFEPAPVDVPLFCRGIIADLAPQMEAGVSIDVRYDGDCDQLMLDGNLLRQILENLLTNAIKYSPERGIVHLRVGCQPESITFRVTDEGIGIPPTDVPHMFEPFHRARNVEHIKGTGLGLAIVQQAVDMHQGTVTVESELGVGTTFTVTLPVPAPTRDGA